MGRLVDGKWVTRDLGPDERGRYVRRATKFRNRITADGSSGFAAEPDRYHLYISHACGWSHRTLIARQLKQLERAISISVAQPFMGDQGWTFGPQADPVVGIRHMHQLYTRAQADYTGRASVPVLWDKKTEAIVSNESMDIMEVLDSQFDAMGDASVRLFPDDLRSEIDAMIAANYRAVNNGVYRAGFAGSQDAHREAVLELFGRLDELEAVLSQQRYLCGNRVTAADWCLFPTLYRFDLVYHCHFKCNIRRLADYPNLWAYTRDLYQTPGIAEICYPDDIKEHYYRSHESINPRRLVPLGPSIDYDAPHGRQAPGSII